MKYVNSIIGKDGGFSDYLRGMFYAYYALPEEEYDTQLHIHESLAMAKVFKNVKLFHCNFPHNFAYLDQPHQFHVVINDLKDNDHAHASFCMIPPEECFAQPKPRAVERFRELITFKEPYRTQINAVCDRLTNGEPYRVVVCRCGDYAFENCPLEEHNIKTAVDRILNVSAGIPTVFVCDYEPVTDRVLSQREDFISYRFAPCYLCRYTGPVEGCLPILTAYQLLCNASEIYNFGRWHGWESGFARYPAKIFGIPYHYIHMNFY